MPMAETPYPTEEPYLTGAVIPTERLRRPRVHSVFVLTRSDGASEGRVGLRLNGLKD